MTILNFLLRRTPEPNYEITESKLIVEDCKYRIRVITLDNEIENIDTFFKTFKQLSFSRFFSIKEELFKPSFAPSISEAINWFTGKEVPCDGYSHIYWGNKTIRECPNCDGVIRIPFMIKKIESLTIYNEIPRYQEIIGWRVSEVESELMGKGIPDCYYTIHGGHSIIRWESPNENILCKRCSG